eukprot:TRINITY_DN4013_c0_g1_i7.p2 TRINITY_DN4013_c0_g1~~TRINITY_DN4013_c0_g1_i7.p2  ORF type:complete len:155 (-),score=34.62 TRINITY_DN4013_c0_g1_i7:33-497(-)
MKAKKAKESAEVKETIKKGIDVIVSPIARQKLQENITDRAPVSLDVKHTSISLPSSSSSSSTESDFIFDGGEEKNMMDTETPLSEAKLTKNLITESKKRSASKKGKKPKKEGKKKKEKKPGDPTKPKKKSKSIKSNKIKAPKLGGGRARIPTRK